MFIYRVSKYVGTTRCIMLGTYSPLNYPSAFEVAPQRGDGLKGEEMRQVRNPLYNCIMQGV